LRQRLGRIAWAAVRVALVGAVLYYLGRHIADNIDSLREYEFRPHPLWLSASFLSLMAGLFGLSTLYQLLLRERPPGLARAFAMMSLPALGKYVPGKVGVVIGTAWAFERCGYRRARGVYLLLYVQAAIIIGGLICGLLFSVAAPHTSIWLRLSPLLALGGIPLLHPAMLDRLVAFTSRMLRLPPIDLVVPTGMVFAAVGLSAAGMLASGVGFALLLASMGELTGEVLLLAIGVYPLAQCLGFLTLVAPGGIGIREGVLIVALEPVIGAEAAIVSSIAIRILQTVADVLAAGIALWITRSIPREDRAP